MVVELLDIIKESGFADAELSLEKVILKEFGFRDNKRFSRLSDKKRVFCRTFKDGGFPAGFSVSGNDKRSVKQALMSVSGLNPISQKGFNFVRSLPAEARKVKLEIYDRSFESIGDKEFEELKILIEENCLNFPGLKVNSVKLQKSEKKYYLANTGGLNVKYRKTAFSLESKFFLNGNSIDVSRHSTHFNKIDPFKLVPGVYTLLNSLTDNNLPLKRRYGLVFSPEASSSILRLFSVYFLPGKYVDAGKVNFPRILNIADNKMLEYEIGSVPFDDEGVQGFETALIEKGIFSSPVSNLKLSSEKKILSSGNGFRRGDSPFPSVNFSNLYIKPTILPVGKLLNGEGEKLLISLVKLKYRSGKKYIFSAYGYIFKNGERTEPVHFLISMTFLTFFLNIMKISNEIKFFYSDFNVGSPYLLLQGEKDAKGNLIEI